MVDTIQFEILEDGTISIETDKISGQNHVSADELLAEVAKLIGGKVDIRHKKGVMHQQHGHDHHHKERAKQ